MRKSWFPWHGSDKRSSIPGYASVVQQDHSSCTGLHSLDYGASKITCLEFKRHIFNAPENGRGDRNLLEAVYEALPSEYNVDFIGMTQFLNQFAKGFFWGANFQQVVERALKASIRGPFHRIAIPTLNKELDVLQRINLAVKIINLPVAIEMAQNTNKRIYLELRKLDQHLAAETGLEAFAKGFFAPNFRTFMDDYINHPTNGAKAVFLNSALSLKSDLEEKLEKVKVLAQGFDESDSKYQEIMQKWQVYNTLGHAAWTIELSWVWPTCGGNARRDGSEPDLCELPPLETTSQITSSLSTESAKTTTPPSVSSVPTTLSQPHISPMDACGTQQCGTLSCPDGRVGDCMVLPMGRGYACGCQPYTWTEHYQSITSTHSAPSPTSTLESPCDMNQCSTINCPDGQAGECMVQPMGRGYACGCQPRTWTEMYSSSSSSSVPQVASTIRPNKPTCMTNEDCRGCGTDEIGECIPLPIRGPSLCVCLPKIRSSRPMTSSSLAATTTAPPPRYTGLCNTQGERFDKSQASKWVKEFCEDAHKNKWSNKWFYDRKNRKVETKGINIYNKLDEREFSYTFTIEVLRRSNERNIFCEAEGEGSNPQSALELLQKNPSACEEQFGILLDCKS
ncbi:uncharacterized protein CTRU02_202660 [Colletotrichum truncatum]|uniref:Uncharacterized protein n=1 Tax=Colletotrichum truncatum TaxID=5467 RepID=A0ACC3ZLJ2_COLTU